MMSGARFLTGAIMLVGLAAVAALAASQATPPTSKGGARIGGGGEATAPLDRWQPRQLPALPSGITLATVRTGDSLFHGKAGCVACHGPDGFGMPNMGSGITLGLHFIPITLPAIDSLVTAGIPEALTRTTIAMPPRGASQNLTPEEIHAVAGYVWAIANVADEPWPGGHRTHVPGGAPTAAPAPAKKP